MLENGISEFWTEGTIHCWKSAMTIFMPMITSSSLLISKELAPEGSKEDLAESDCRDTEQVSDSDDLCSHWRMNFHCDLCFHSSLMRNYRDAFQKLKSSDASDEFCTKYLRERNSKASWTGLSKTWRQRASPLKDWREIISLELESFSSQTLKLRIADLLKLNEVPRKWITTIGITTRIVLTFSNSSIKNNLSSIFRLYCQPLVAIQNHTI